MNIERLTEIAEWLEGGGDKKIEFYMRSWIRPRRENPSCDTACCIGGYADLKWCGTSRIHTPAQEALGLTGEQADSLFYLRDDTSGLSFRDITAEHAARVVRHLIKTGEVDWTV